MENETKQIIDKMQPFILAFSCPIQLFQRWAERKYQQVEDNLLETISPDNLQQLDDVNIFQGI